MGHIMLTRMDCKMSSYMYALKCGTIIMSSEIIV